MTIKHLLAVVILCGGILAYAPEETHANTSNASIEATVREYFADIPVMIEIARCESRFRQFNNDGSVLRGGLSSGMVGIFQFYESIHRQTALTLGFDLHTIDGNLGYARHLYEASGTTPWNSARACWNVPLASAQQTSELTPAQKEVLLSQIVTLLKIVSDLQVLLEQQKTLTMR